MCCYCMLVGWMDGSNEGLLEGSYRHSSHAAGRIPRWCRFSKYGKGDSEFGAVCCCASVCLAIVRVVVVVGNVVLLRILPHIWFLYLTPSFVSCFHYCAIAFGCWWCSIILERFDRFHYFGKYFYSIVTCYYCFFWRVHAFGLKSVCILCARCIFVVLVVVVVTMSISSWWYIFQTLPFLHESIHYLLAVDSWGGESCRHCLFSYCFSLYCFHYCAIALGCWWYSIIIELFGIYFSYICLCVLLLQVSI